MKKSLQAILTFTIALSGAVFAQQAPTLVLPMTFLGESDSLFNMSLKSQAITANQGPYQATEMLQKHGPMVDVDTGLVRASISVPLGAQPYVQTIAANPPSPANITSFEGPGIGLTGFVMTGAPPDTTMAVGPSHIVAWVNSMYAVFDKTGTVLPPGPTAGNALFAGVGGGCDTTNRGDPILQYDKLADRWFLSQFAFGTSAGSIVGPYLQCIAVSTTSSPLGTYYRYSIAFSSTSPSGFNDYGKLGVWPDAYYTAYNMFGGSPAGANTGAAMCASDRLKMLAGDPTATTLCAPVAFYGGGASFLPADMEGTTLPTDVSQGGMFMRYSFGGISLRIFKLKPTFATSTVTIGDGFGGFGTSAFINIPVGATTVACNGAASTCVAQPGTTTVLDTLADRLMYRLSYRNRGGVDSLVVNQSVDPDGAGARSSAVRWYEVRSPLTAAPTLFQNATYDPGAASDRWMGSIASDKLGNLMLGYSVANAGTGLKPSLRVAGRLRTDIKNTLRSEVTLITGTGSQTITAAPAPLTRWGDYTTMQVDPVNDCTFWYIGQYLATDGTFNWRTRIGSFKFTGCN